MLRDLCRPSQAYKQPLRTARSAVPRPLPAVRGRGAGGSGAAAARPLRFAPRALSSASDDSGSSSSAANAGSGGAITQLADAPSQAPSGMEAKLGQSECATAPPPVVAAAAAAGAGKSSSETAAPVSSATAAGPPGISSIAATTSSSNTVNTNTNTSSTSSGGGNGDEADLRRQLSELSKLVTSQAAQIQEQRAALDAQAAALSELRANMRQLSTAAAAPGGASSAADLNPNSGSSSSSGRNTTDGATAAAAAAPLAGGGGPLLRASSPGPGFVGMGVSGGIMGENGGGVGSANAAGSGVPVLSGSPPMRPFDAQLAALYDRRLLGQADWRWHSAGPGATPVDTRILPKRIILIRHAESEGNLDARHYTNVPDPQVALGEEQAHAAGHAIRSIMEAATGGGGAGGRTDYKLYFFISPYMRSRQTYEGIRAAFAPSQIAGMQEEVQLREQDFGNFQDADRKEKEKAERLRYGRFFYRFPQGESGADVYNRVTIFQDHLVRDLNAGRFEPGTSLVLVTHGLALRIFLMRWLHWTVNELHRVYNPRNAVPIVLELMDRPLSMSARATGLSSGLSSSTGRSSSTGLASGLSSSTGLPFAGVVDSATANALGGSGAGVGGGGAAAAATGRGWAHTKCLYRLSRESMENLEGLTPDMCWTGSSPRCDSSAAVDPWTEPIAAEAAAAAGDAGDGGDAPAGPPGALDGGWERSW